MGRQLPMCLRFAKMCVAKQKNQNPWENLLCSLGSANARFAVLFLSPKIMRGHSLCSRNRSVYKRPIQLHWVLNVTKRISQYRCLGHFYPTLTDFHSFCLFKTHVIFNHGTSSSQIYLKISHFKTLINRLKFWKESIVYKSIKHILLDKSNIELKFVWYFHLSLTHCARSCANSSVTLVCVRYLLHKRFCFGYTAINTLAKWPDISLLSQMHITLVFISSPRTFVHLFK